MNGHQGAALQLRVDGKYLVAFLALTILCGTSHEFIHHFAGAAMCGCFGSKTFNSFSLCSSCQGNDVALFVSAWAGPLFTYALMWWGAARILSASQAARQLGFALLFANFPINRMLFVLMGANDEQFATRRVFGESVIGFWMNVIVVWLFAVPPLVIAYRSIANRRRWLWFGAFFVLPFIFVVGFAGLLLENFLLLKHRVLANAVLGIPMLIVVVELVALLLYWRYRDSIAGGGAVRGGVSLERPAEISA